MMRPLRRTRTGLRVSLQGRTQAARAGALHYGHVAHPPVKTTSRRTFGVLLALEALAFAWMAFALLDRATHQRIQMDFGVNQWGYRGEAHGSKEPGELRVMLAGGSAAFEPALRYAPTLAGRLYIELR